MIDIDPNLKAPVMINLTFGKSHTEIRWTDRREMSFADFAKILSSAKVGNKNGECYTPAVFTGTARRMDQAESIDVAVLDSDCGHTLIEIRDALKKQNWSAIIHSTHSHLSDTTLLAAQPFEKWQADNQGKTVSDYLLEKKGFLPRIVEGAEIIDEMRDGAARNLVIRHQPCPKYRVIVLLAKSWIASSFDSQQAANAIWRERIGTLAHALGLHHDQSCVDTSRLFYLPRIKTSDSPFEFFQVIGDPCPLFELPDAPISAPLFANVNHSHKPMPVLQSVKKEHHTLIDPQGRFFDLTVWAAEYAGRFEIVSAISAKCPEIFSRRISGVKHHIVCPNSGLHVTAGAEGTGTYVVNASDLQRSGLTQITSGFVIHCMHAGCAGLDRLDHIRAMLEAGSLEIDDLTDDRFLTSEVDVDISGFMTKVNSKSLSTAPKIASTARVNEQAQGKANRGSNIDSGLYANLPPIMRDMHDYICMTAPKPQPALALGAVLAFFGAAIGRKAELAYFGTRANIYTLAIAHSGAGKDRILTACKDLAAVSGLPNLIGVEEVASDAGIIAEVMHAPNQVMLLDEVSFLISATHNVKAGVHVANVTSTLLKLYSSSRTLFKGKSYADRDKVKTVNQPCVSIVGCSTPAGLYRALSSQDVTNGLLSRFVLFDAGDHDPFVVAPKKMPKPRSVIEWLTAWHQRPLNENPVAMEGGEPLIDPFIVPMTDDALLIANEFEREMHERKINSRTHGTDALYVRALENALKFALVAACSVPASSEERPKIDLMSLVVNRETMKWACDLSRSTIIAMETGVRNEIVDSEYQNKMRNLRQVIEKSEARGLSQYEITRTPAGRMPARDLTDVIRSLVDAGEIFYLTIPGKTKKGRPRLAYVHKNFVQQNEEE